MDTRSRDIALSKLFLLPSEKGYSKNKKKKYC